MVKHRRQTKLNSTETPGNVRDVIYQPKRVRDRSDAGADGAEEVLRIYEERG